MTVFFLGDSCEFPPAELADSDGLLAFGGDLKPERLLTAYRSGIFPWYEQPGQIFWWSPDPRAVLIPHQFHRSRSLQKVLRKADIHLLFDQDFDAVIQWCAQVKRRGETGTWILPEMIVAYRQLFKKGFAHSFLVKNKNGVLGGLYGVHLGAFFFAESMFSLQPNGSKIAMSFMVDWAIAQNIQLIDCQFCTDHLQTLGVKEIARSVYLQKLGCFFSKTQG